MAKPAELWKAKMRRLQLSKEHEELVLRGLGNRRGRTEKDRQRLEKVSRAVEQLDKQLYD